MSQDKIKDFLRNHKGEKYSAEQISKYMDFDIYSVYANLRKLRSDIYKGLKEFNFEWKTDANKPFKQYWYEEIKIEKTEEEQKKINQRKLNMFFDLERLQKKTIVEIAKIKPLITDEVHLYEKAFKMQEFNTYQRKKEIIELHHQIIRELEKLR